MASKTPLVKDEQRTYYKTPANSTDIADGDAVMVDASNRLAVLTETAIGSTNFLGFSNGLWDQQTAIDMYGGVAAYSTPASFAGGKAHRQQVFGKGHVVSIPITETSGEAGMTVWCSTFATGSQVFTTLQPATAQSAVEVGTLARTFTGATASDRQEVIVGGTYADQDRDLGWYLNNHVMEGLTFGFDATSKASYAAGAVFVGGKYFSVAAAESLDMAACASHATKARIALAYIGTGGTALAKDTGNVRFTFTTAGATALAVLRNSHYWPTFSQEGVVFGACVFRSGSANIAASRAATVIRSLADIRARKYLTGNPWASGSPTLR